MNTPSEWRVEKPKAEQNSHGQNVLVEEQPADM